MRDRELCDVTIRTKLFEISWKQAYEDTFAFLHLCFSGVSIIPDSKVRLHHLASVSANRVFFRSERSMFAKVLGPQIDPSPPNPFRAIRICDCRRDREIARGQ